MPFVFLIIFLIGTPIISGGESFQGVEAFSVSCGPNEVLQGFTNGAPICKKIEQLRPRGGGPQLHVFTSSGTWTNTGSVSSVRIRVVGGGGGGYYGIPGDSYVSDVGGSGGGGGGYCESVIDVSKISSITITVGSGGAGAVGGQENSNGGDGGTSSFGTYCTATGGQGAKLIGSKNSPGAGGVGKGGILNLKGQGGTSFTRKDPNGVFIEGGQVNGHGESSALGAGGTAPGSVGELYGGGGAGGLKTSGGAGASGVVIVEEY